MVIHLSPSSLRPPFPTPSGLGFLYACDLFCFVSGFTWYDPGRAPMELTVSGTQETLVSPSLMDGQGMGR